MGIGPRRLAGVSVLVVEDHDDTREVWERTLEYAGALVTGASSGSQALALCATLRPDVVVTDLSMPDGDGLWLAEQLRMQGALMPIIAISGYVAAFAKSLQAAFFVHVLQKPLDPWELVEVVASVTSNQPPSQ
jgi:CheY-like chemotaxis protein